MPNFKQQLKVGDLKKTHDKYKNNIEEWRFTMAMYEGIRSIRKLGLVERHEREGLISYNRRMKELYGFGYSKSVVEIFQHHLFKRSPQGRKLDTLGNDELWKQFMEDADIHGNNYESTIMNIALNAGIQGHMGILVDRANVSKDGKPVSRQFLIDNQIYPYLSIFHPPAILDWVFSRDKFNRPYLSFLKLLDDSGQDKQYIFYYPEYWEVWEIPKDESGKPINNDETDAVFINAGENILKEIPFIWHYNFKTRKQGIGSSDIHEVGRIDLSIIRNLSQIEAIINFAAYPMMRKPMRDASPTSINAPQQVDEVGIEVVLEFDPDHSESKPDWLESKVKEPIEATWAIIEGKVAELYRSANIGGMASTEPTRNAQSGVSKRIDFQLLASKLVSKAINLENTENKILEYWLKWENLYEKYKDKTNMSRPKTFDIEDLSADLENALTSKTIVLSKKFNELVQKQTTRLVLPSATEQELQQIDEEIVESIESSPLEGGKNKVDQDAAIDKDNEGIIDSGGQGNNNFISDENE